MIVPCEHCGTEFEKPNCYLKKTKHHFCCHKCSSEWRVGERHHYWKGGHSVNCDGYVYRWTKKDRGKIEHRLVYEKFIGRKLIKGETVHHKNGIKTDNRIENLELWSKAQPAGQRVEDKINWAKEFLENYGYVVLDKVKKCA